MKCCASANVTSRYTAAFARFAELEPPALIPDRETAWHLYILRLRLGLLNITRGKFINELKRRGVMACVHFIPLHLHPYYRETYGHSPGNFPVAEKEYERYLSLRLYAGMTDAEVDYVIAKVQEIVTAYRKRRFSVSYSAV